MHLFLIPHDYLILMSKYVHMKDIHEVDTEGLINPSVEIPNFSVISNVQE